MFCPYFCFEYNSQQWSQSTTVHNLLKIYRFFHNKITIIRGEIRHKRKYLCFFLRKFLRKKFAFEEIQKSQWLESFNKLYLLVRIILSSNERTLIHSFFFSSSEIRFFSCSLYRQWCDIQHIVRSLLCPRVRWFELTFIWRK